MIRRSQLVGQWQNRLQAAEQLSAETARFRWFHLARVRLYRFLLSCYGSGQWRSGIEDADGLRRSPPAQDFPALQLLEGKPPKSVGAIQSVLKAVHNAQDHSPPVGPLVGGLDPQTYMAVTSSDAKIDVERCEQFLLSQGLHARVVGRGRRMTVEVPYAELSRAEVLVDAQRDMLRPVLKTSADKLRQNPPFPEETQMLVVGLTLIAPVVGMAAVAIGASVLNYLPESVSVGWILAGLFLGGFIAVAEISLLWYVVGPRWRKGVTLATRRRIARAVWCLCIGVPAALVVTLAIVEFHASPVVQSLLTSKAAVTALVLTLAGICHWGVSHLLKRHR